MQVYLHKNKIEYGNHDPENCDQASMFDSVLRY